MGSRKAYSYRVQVQNCYNLINIALIVRFCDNVALSI